MKIRSKRLRHILFDMLYYTRALHLTQRRRSGIGVIFLLHRVVPTGTRTLDSDLSVQSDFLDEMLAYVKRLGWAIVKPSDVYQRLVERGTDSNFACFTFDDGYLDNLTVALSVFRKHGVPMCVYITTGLIDRTHYLWWPVLEQMLLTRDQIKVVVDGRQEVLPNYTREQKERAYQRFVPLLSCHTNSEPQAMELFRLNGIDPVATVSPLMMDWEQVRELAADPLVEIGCHSVSHRALANITEDEVVSELTNARETLEKKLSLRILHMSYPYGRKPECSTREFRLAQKVGFLTATTTRPGNIFPAHRDHLTALPRVNIRGGEESSLRVISEGLFGESVRLDYAPALVTD